MGLKNGRKILTGGKHFSAASNKMLKGFKDYLRRRACLLLKSPNKIHASYSNLSMDGYAFRRTNEIADADK